MPSATASGSDAKDDSSTRNREHNQGNQGRKYTPDQRAAVIRIQKCSTTAYYEILSVEKTATDVEIKKAYRKQSLLTHPDKNGHEGADEAFKRGSFFGSFFFLVCPLTYHKRTISRLSCLSSVIRPGQKVEI